jgi:type IV secretory pathway TrbL component
MYFFLLRVDILFYLAGVYILDWFSFFSLRSAGTGETHFISSEFLKLYISTGVTTHYYIFVMG